MWATLVLLWTVGALVTSFVGVMVAFGASEAGDDMSTSVLTLVVLAVTTLAVLSALVVARARKSPVHRDPPRSDTRVDESDTVTTDHDVMTRALEDGFRLGERALPGGPRTWSWSHGDEQWPSFRTRAQAVRWMAGRLPRR